MSRAPSSLQKAERPRWSGGSARPCLQVPILATDCHHHIYDSSFRTDPVAALFHEDATVGDYRGLAAWLGIARHVLVQPSLYGLDNRVLLQALDEFGDTARGVVVIDHTVSDRELEGMHVRGVRGARINMRLPGGVGFEGIDSLAARIACLGWHIQIAVDFAHIPNLVPILSRLPCPIVFDHMAYLRGEEGLRHPAFACLANLLESGKAWMKLSGAYIGGHGAGTDYHDVLPIGRAFVRLANERILWGSDWPHPTVRGAKPDDAKWLDFLAKFTSDCSEQHRILVTNAAKLYGF